MAREITPSALTASLDRYFTGVTARRQRRGFPAPQVLVRAAGFEYTSGDQAMSFHAASIGKLATAALIMQEVEAGRLDLSQPVEALLPAAEARGLFASSDATLEQLLAHTSGTPDYFEGKVNDGPTFIERVTGAPERRWEPAELLDFSRDHQQPLAEPGKRFAYSDTGFVALGRIIEEHTGQSFTEVLRERIFTPAGMTDSVLWRREPGPEQIAPAWLGRVEVSGFESITCDWAGGGIVTTLADLATLVTALSDGTLLQPASWGAMTEVRHRFRPGIHYGLGAMELRFEGFMPLLRGLPRPVGHIGVLGTHAFIDPATGAAVALNFHSTREMVNSFQAHIRIQQGLARLS